VPAIARKFLSGEPSSRANACLRNEARFSALILKYTQQLMCLVGTKVRLGVAKLHGSVLRAAETDLRPS